MARRARNPFPALVAAAALPALALGAAWRFAEARAPDEVSVPVVDDTQPIQLPPPLATPLLSVRRAPSVLARDTNLASFRAALQPLLDSIDGSSCFVVSIDGEAVAAKNETVSLRPASNVKLPVAAVALDVLGPGFVYTTTVSGQLDGGVVGGDLALVGGGDPLLSSSWWNGPNAKFPPFNVTPIESLADAIKAAGITSITGSVVGDASRYDDEWYPPTWDESFRFSEGGPISALLVNDSREAIDRSSGDPAIGAATVLTDLLRERGITVGGAPRAGAATSGAPTIASVSSQPLPAVLAEMLTTSDNNTAEMVLKEIGRTSGGVGTREAGLAVVAAKLAEWGIDTEGVALVDGSGLSDENRLTCAALLALLQRGSIDDPVGQGLPVGGEPGGTLAAAFAVGEPLSGVIRAKTGTLNNADGEANKPGAKALSGYVPVEGGGVIEFSLLLNGETISDQSQYRPIWQQMASILAAYPSGPTPTELAPR